MARKILLADDSVTAQNMGRKILADAGYEVITVNNGSAALKKISEQRPDLIVLDVYMPGYSGLEVCQRLKEVGDTSRIPILLTVGKLEPFKPEEAKRVRADAFIVKPFEASELLSALSKLEDKVVPRGETTKTGRFSRVSAAIEESRYDKSMAVEEDAGWKSRIVFPKKKKEKTVEPEVEDASIYNPVNKDLRTVVEHPSIEPEPIAAPQEHNKPEQEDARVDVSALAPAGLPKDVTPEEIAALAAAAAQVQGKLAEENVPAPAAELPVVAPSEEAPQSEITASFQPAEPVAAPVPEVSAPATSAAPASSFAQHEPEKEPEKVELKKVEEEKIAEEKTAEDKIDAEKTEQEKTEDREPVPEVAASSAAVMAAIANLETEAVESAPASSEHGAWTPSHAEKTEEPVTMAVATPANSAPAASRWAAVTVALAPEDSGVSLEQEMQKAHAAYAAAEGATMAVAFAEAPAATVSEPHKLETAPAELAPTESISIAPAPVTASPVQTWPSAEAPAPATVPSPAEAAPEAAETMSAVANVATDAIRAAAAELESVAAAYAAEKAAVSAPVSKHEAEDPSSSVSETPQIEAKAEPTPVAEPLVAEEKEEAKATAETAEQERIEARADDQTDDEEPAIEESKAAVEAATEFPAATPAAEAPAEKASEGRISEEPATAVPAVSKAGRTDDMEKQESDTAAAWASWRKIRETRDSKQNRRAGFSSDSEEVKDAAMAVAAGAEHHPEDADSGEADPEISSIVDSVLADLRPKIAEEISRKLGKKK